MSDKTMNHSIGLRKVVYKTYMLQISTLHIPDIVQEKGKVLYNLVLMLSQNQPERFSAQRQTTSETLSSDYE